MGSVLNHGVGSLRGKASKLERYGSFFTLKIWMFENKFVSLPSHLKTIEPMEVYRGSGTMCNTKTSKVISAHKVSDPL